MLWLAWVAEPFGIIYGWENVKLSGLFMQKEELNLAQTTKRSALEKAFEKIVTPFDEFIHRETTSGLLLMLGTLLALLLANIGFYDSYLRILQTPMTLALADWHLEKSLHHWVNDGLMTLFFFVVGLEIKRETLAGELSDFRMALLPFFAAAGGMLVPALIFLMFNLGGEAQAGWGIPMATDIAFAVGVMALLGPRVPKALLMFLVALAIVDDLGAVLVIALFYTETIQLVPLYCAVLFFSALVGMNRVGIRKPWPYFLLGALLWFALLSSGIHATLAGVLTALTIPARPRYEPQQFSALSRQLLARFDAQGSPSKGILSNQDQMAILQTFEHCIHSVATPLQRLEHALHKPVAFLVIPIFALSNAGIQINWAELTELLFHPLALGVILGLVLGKFIGIAGFSYIVIKLQWARLPEGVGFCHLMGAALLGGIGFTMSIFIAELAFVGEAQLLLIAKTGILAASVIAGVAGLIWLYVVSLRHDAAKAQSLHPN